MVDIVLMVAASLRLNRLCKQAGIAGGPHIAKMLGFWFASEVVGVLLFLRLNYDIYLTAVLSMVIGMIAGYLSYRQSLIAIKEAGNKSEEPPRLNG
jgi:hypothetical protein